MPDLPRRVPDSTVCEQALYLLGDAQLQSLHLVGVQIPPTDIENELSRDLGYARLCRGVGVLHALCPGLLLEQVPEYCAVAEVVYALLQGTGGSCLSPGFG